MSTEIFRKLAKEVVEYFDYDLADRDGFIHRGTVKKLDSLICTTRTTIINIGNCTKSHSDVGSWQRGINYDDESVAELLQGLHRLKTYKKAEQIASDYLDAQGERDIFARLYLTLFAYECITRYVKNGMKLEEKQIDEMATSFEKDLNEKSMWIKTTIGMKDICATEEIVSQDPLEILKIRPVKKEDIPQVIAVRDNGMGDLDRTNRPYLPDLTGILEIYLNQFTVRRDDMGFIYVKQWDSNTVFDLVLSGINIETNRTLDLFYLFQAKQIPKMKTWKVFFYLNNLSNNPIYEKEIPLSRSTDIELRPFLFKKEFEIPFENFCKKMHSVDFIERIFHYSDDPKHSLSHVEQPLEIAYKRYLKLMSYTSNVKQKIHDTVEALEAFFTPEQPKTKEEFLKFNKIFIKRISKLMQILGKLDPNPTEKVLRFAFKIRSEHSHRGQGWDIDEVDADSEDLEIDIEEVFDNESRKYDYDNLNKLSDNLMNYLKISIICRILGGIPDKDFIDLLDSKKGEGYLKNLFSDLFDILSCDQLNVIYV